MTLGPGATIGFVGTGVMGRPMAGGVARGSDAVITVVGYPPDLGADLPGLELAETLYSRLAADGGEELGTQALSLLYDAQARDQVLGLKGDGGA